MAIESSEPSGAPGTPGTPGTPETPSVAKKYANLNLNLDPKSQPYRDEIDAMLRTFFSDNSPQELNVAGHVAEYARCHSKYTTHPDVFAQVDECVLQNMQSSSLQSFLNHALENINYDGKVFRWSAACGFFTAFLLTNIIVFSMHYPRWWRIFGLPFAFFAVVYVVSAQTGVCFTRAMNKQRELHDYELLGIPPYKPDETKPHDKSSLNEWKKVVDPLVLKFNMVTIFYIGIVHYIHFIIYQQALHCLFILGAYRSYIVFIGNCDHCIDSYSGSSTSLISLFRQFLISVYRYIFPYVRIRFLLFSKYCL